MSRIVLKGASSTMPWAARTVQVVAAPKIIGTEQQISSNASRQISVPPRVSLSQPNHQVWSDERCSRFLNGRLEKLLNPGPEDAKAFWEYFLMMVDAKAEVGEQTYNTLLSIMSQVGAIDDAARAASMMQDNNFTILPDSAAEMISAYAMTGQNRLALETLRFFATENNAVEKTVDATFSKLSNPNCNLFARSLLQNLPKFELGEANRNNYISVAKGSYGGLKALEVLNKMEYVGLGTAKGPDVNGSLSWACGTARDINGASYIVRQAEKADATNSGCYEGLAIGYNQRGDVRGSGDTLHRYQEVGHDIQDADFLLKTVATTAAPHALHGDAYATDLCKEILETAETHNIKHKDAIKSIIKDAIK
eukprot:TRINITY_DN17758_c0_g1_i1.p1 TRINITY_DN17758_c0_g1~~TRINITY_DN17758_c0_g1_i1.p1  ORF type:complete len:365 (+),score=74.66 TRINITY_DN17758_c0_g1_i1:40-1134(+)